MFRTVIRPYHYRTLSYCHQRQFVIVDEVYINVHYYTSLFVNVQNNSVLQTYYYRKLTYCCQRLFIGDEVLIKKKNQYSQEISRWNGNDGTETKQCFPFRQCVQGIYDIKQLLFLLANVRIYAIYNGVYFIYRHIFRDIGKEE